MNINYFKYLTEEGHCPEEDAIASLELAMLKLRKGYEFGDICIGGIVSHFCYLLS